MRKKFKEVPPRNTLNVQIMLHKLMNGARLRKLMRNGGVCEITFTVSTKLNNCACKIHVVRLCNIFNVTSKLNVG